MHEQSVGYWQAECGRLEQQVKALEEERARDRETISELASERDHYFQSLLSLVKSQVPKAQLEQWANEEPEGLPLAEFLGELEQIVNESSQR